MPETFEFHLFVAGNAPYSSRALTNLRAICQQHLPGRHRIEVIDVFADPERALAEGVLLTPLVVGKGRCSGRRVLGTLTDAEAFLTAFDLSCQTP